VIPEMIEHYKPECKQNNINANLLYNLFIYEPLTLNRNRVLTQAEFSSDHLYYFGIDYEIIWDVASNYLPENKKQIENILNKEKRSITIRSEP
jgi:hypothetical protein